MEGGAPQKNDIMIKGTQSADTTTQNPVGPTQNQRLLKWVKEMEALCKPDQVHWCDGSEEEYNRLTEMLVEKGTFIRLNIEKRPNSFACFSDPSDVARV